MKNIKFYCLKELNGKTKCKNQCKNCKIKPAIQKDKKTLL